MTLNLKAVQQAAEMMYVADANKVYGDKGNLCLGRLINGIREFFSFIPPDQLDCSFVFIYSMCDEYASVLPDGLNLIANEVDRGCIAGYRRYIEDFPVVFVVVQENENVSIYWAEEVKSPEVISNNAIVFVNEKGIDRFVIGGRSRQMPKFATGAPSNFSVPTVADLDEALARYRLEARDVACHILADIWEGGRDGHRLVFSNKPEAIMRRSLERYLGTRIRDVSVRPEYNTDETKPVDLVVNWFGSKLRALIEIKWVGVSLAKSSDGTSFTRYSDSRVQDGMKQLVDYIDREASTDPTVTIRGYVVVFDGRRRSVKAPTVPVSRDDALFYRHVDFKLTRDYSRERSDVAPVVRYFLEPRESLFA